MKACDLLALSEAQQAFALKLFTHYSEEKSRVLADRVEHVQGARERIGMVEPPEWRDLGPAERIEARQAAWSREMINELNDVTRRSTEAARVQGATVRRELFDRLGEILSETQQDCLPRIEQFLRRRAIISTTHLPRRVRQNLMLFVELHAIVAEAQEEHGELADIRIPGVCECDEDIRDDADLAQGIAAIMRAYDFAVDRHLRQAPEQTHLIHSRLTKSSAEGQEAAALQQIRRQAALHLEPFLLLQRAGDQIEALIREHLGEAAAEAWADRIASAMFPLLYQRETPDRMYEWLEGLDLNEDQRAAIEASYGEYHSNRRALRRHYMTVTIQIMQEASHRTSSPSPRSKQLHAQMESIQSARHELAAQTHARFQTAVGDAAAAEYDRRLAEARRARDFVSRESPP